ncbi:hypothetical protein BC332_08023 [Capsicum chinense]|nr:hypothetical protein BC332_08023 [Capsicum chinense]
MALMCLFFIEILLIQHFRVGISLWCRDANIIECYSYFSLQTGDNYLKPYITSEPEMTFTKREAEYECLILASDGLWDVISSEVACEVGRECLREGDPAGYSRAVVGGDGRGEMFSPRSACSAAVLLCDNISVIVVDLKRNHTAL